MYDNLIKSAARGWAWNRISDRIKNTDARRRARVYCLIGDTVKELETAEKKGFSKFNVIGVDVRKESVEAWRAAGGIAIQAPLEAVIALSKYDPSAVIADFCGGLTKTSLFTFHIALHRTMAPGCIVVNLLRGRDHAKHFGPSEDVVKVIKEQHLQYAKTIKKRSVILFYDLFKGLYGDTIMNNIKFNVPVDIQFKLAEQEFDKYFNMFKSKTNPQFYDYKSQDSNQYFDSLALNSIQEKPNKEVALQLIESFNENKYDFLKIKRRLAAMEAIRTQKIRQMKQHYWEKYEPLAC
jgi:hypothetical protein